MKKRGQNLVLRRFQTWFLVRLFLYALAFSALLLVGFTIWYRAIFTEILSVGGLLSSTYVEVLQQKAERGFWILCSISLSLLIVTTYFGFLFSARIAGPLYALLRHLEKCGDKGELIPMKLRKGDQFTEIADKFNEMAGRLKGR
jgi:methyl-accepting chemotaxis protein